MKVDPRAVHYMQPLGFGALDELKIANIHYQHKGIIFINQKYGKNAAYAVLALDLLENRQDARDNANFWIQVTGFLQKNNS